MAIIDKQGIRNIDLCKWQDGADYEFQLLDSIKKTAYVKYLGSAGEKDQPDTEAIQTFVQTNGKKIAAMIRTINTGQRGNYIEDLAVDTIVIYHDFLALYLDSEGNLTETDQIFGR
ncbi:hypothetical protein FHQ08_12010 [Lactobacillus sp. CC-MHH1034]|uniref:hypothetical protein n=1 Tax=Agrilactobacillus fermenti TaxID=2586909 RepID=UPI001E5F221E|nr:hypothetical protein [Agrilactobacillus fermenti]MCD2257411.1 hypothetical protein [Agrilactobacillus fermenti]